MSLEVDHLAEGLAADLAVVLGGCLEGGALREDLVEKVRVSRYVEMTFFGLLCDNFYLNLIECYIY